MRWPDLPRCAGTLLFILLPVALVSAAEPLSWPAYAGEGCSAGVVPPLT